MIQGAQGAAWCPRHDSHSPHCRYCFSPTLVPFPSDWDRELIDIVGFFFLDNSQSEFQPDTELEAFLAEKDKPVYVGFGSLIVGNVEVRPEPSYSISATAFLSTARTFLLLSPRPAIKQTFITAVHSMKQEEPCRGEGTFAQDLTKHIFKALAHTGQRAIIGKGWAGLGKIKDEPTPPHVLLVDSVPHDWLFPRCSAVIHHGAHAYLHFPYHKASPCEPFGSRQFSLCPGAFTF